MKFDYVAFEDHFRGDPLEIRQKLSVYLPCLQLLKIDELHPVLDIGCGRGEWISLLKDNGIPALGVDVNDDFVFACRESGLQVEAMDIFQFFNKFPDRRFSLITGFHIIEHFSSEKQIELLEILYDRLVPDGVLLLETPNPENNAVGSCNFYIDPTHIRPLPPLLLQFFAQQAGFALSRIVRVNRDTLGITLPFMPENIEYAKYYNRLYELLLTRVFQAPDYALISFKGSAPDKRILDAVDSIIKSESDCIHYEDIDISDEVKHNSEILKEYEITLEAKDRELEATDSELEEKDRRLEWKDIELSRLYEQLNQLRKQNQDCVSTVQVLKIKLADQEERLVAKDSRISEMIERLNQLQELNITYENELHSLYNNELGKLLRKYKKWKKRSKSHLISSNQQEAISLQSVESQATGMESDLSPLAKKIYRRLTHASSHSL
jgi:O-antigen chain-terminating methyltransferase